MIVAYLILCVSLGATLVSASDCIAVSQRDAFRHATLVFQGKVLNIEDVGVIADKAPDEKTAPLRLDLNGPQIVTLVAIRAWKGPVTGVVRIFGFRHPPQGDSYTFSLGKEYIIYTLGEVGEHWAPLRQISGDLPIYDIGMCILRIRTDLANESRLLGKSTVPK